MMVCILWRIQIRIAVRSLNLDDRDIFLGYEVGFARRLVWRGLTEIQFDLLRLSLFVLCSWVSQVLVLPRAVTLN